MALTVATVEAAIEALMGGAQSFTVDGMTYTQNRISALWEIRKQLKREAGHAFGYRMRPLQPPEH